MTRTTNITAKIDHVTLSARVRDNQRRSRARHKEYILELEERVRRFERLGVEATREVQAAGRKVAAENTLLRSLLRHHGVTENNVGEYLRSKTRPDPPPRPSVIAPFNSEVHDLEHDMDPVGGSFSPPNSVIIRHASLLNDQAASADQPPDVDPIIPKASSSAANWRQTRCWTSHVMRNSSQNYLGLARPLRYAGFAI